MESIKNIIKSMTLEQKVGQLFIVAFPSKDISKISPLIEKYQIGGCYISDENATSFKEARKLSTGIQKLALSHNKNLPLLLAVDQEGAWSVLSKDSITGPGNLALGSLDNTEKTELMYSIFAEEMVDVGYQCILGPCCDINLNVDNQIIGTRAFGETVKHVSSHVAASIRGMKKKNCITAAKHFPGHGDTHCDSHREIPIVNKSKEELFKNELLPFQTAINEGVDLIMTSHILYPSFDEKYPATLSYEILTKLLKEKMNFKGLIITDSMNMGAIRKSYTVEESTILALKAGADFIMLSEEHYDHNEDYLKNQIKSIHAIIEAVKNNDIDIKLIEEKLGRIISFKRDKLLKNVKKVLFTSREEKLSIEEQISFDAIKFLKSKTIELPLPNSRIALVNATPSASYENIVNIRGIGPNQRISAFETFSQTFSKYNEKSEIFSYENTSENVLSSFETIILVTEDYPLPGEDFDKIEQEKRVQEILKKFNKRTLLIGFRSSYELELFPDVNNYMCTYSSRNVSAKAAAKKLLNK